MDKPKKEIIGEGRDKSEFEHNFAVIEKIDRIIGPKFHDLMGRYGLEFEVKSRIKEGKGEVGIEVFWNTKEGPVNEETIAMAQDFLINISDSIRSRMLSEGKDLDKSYGGGDEQCEGIWYKIVDVSETTPVDVPDDRVKHVRFSDSEFYDKERSVLYLDAQLREEDMEYFVDNLRNKHRVTVEAEDGTRFIYGSTFLGEVRDDHFEYIYEISSNIGEDDFVITTEELQEGYILISTNYATNEKKYVPFEKAKVISVKGDAHIGPEEKDPNFEIFSNKRDEIRSIIDGGKWKKMSAQTMTSKRILSLDKTGKFSLLCLGHPSQQLVESDLGFELEEGQEDSGQNDKW